MKKTCTMLLSLLLSLLMCMTALADTTSKNDMITIQNLIAERMNNEEIVFFEMGEKVSVEGQCVFTLTDLVSTESNNDGMMDIIAYLSIRSTVENLGLADYDFMLATKTASGNEDYYFPNAIYGYMNNQVQQLAWPVAMSTEFETEIVLRYTVEKETTALALVFTSIASIDRQDYHSTDDIKAYVEYRTLMDFTFENNSGKTINELYVAPKTESNWGKNWLASYTDTTLMNGYWMAIEFAETTYENRSGEVWDMRVDFEDGTYATFGEIDLEDIIHLELVPGNEEGRYTLNVTR